MHGCEKLKTISPNISKLENLEFLGLSNYGKCAFGGHNEDNDMSLMTYLKQQSSGGLTLSAVGDYGQT